MDKPVTIVQVGIGGYGLTYLSALLDHRRDGDYQIVAAVEPRGLRANLAFARAVLLAFERDGFLRRIAWRNVWRNGRRTLVVVSAIAVGLSGTVVSMAINFGMVIQMVETAIATDLGHIQIHARGYEDDPGLDRRLLDGRGLSPEVHRRTLGPGSERGLGRVGAGRR